MFTLLDVGILGDEWKSLADQPTMLWPPPSQKVTFFFLYLRIDVSKIYLSGYCRIVNNYF